ncbi:hypothetical protein [Halomonas nitroreducens]|uniref:Uncharacterized protein n=1 Tax=Halomonas nitroreducens TaxID=447425 RepID=A0A431V1X1_9GAMM|nr:hypothetical protein [Halomonas nitroreducens]RTR02398.1 hypothetical protein EKG36_12430 [Halomonas nitroreducens]
MSRPDHPDMPTAMLPQELLALAIDHEHQELCRYRRLAFRFLTFGCGISPLMAALGIECEGRLNELHGVANEIGLSPSTIEPLEGKPPSSELISDRGQALATLKRAEARARRAVHRTEQLQRRNVDPALQLLLPGHVAQKQAECHILQELLTAYDGEFVDIPRPASPRTTPGVFGRGVSRGSLRP